jgi:hypothetical protein
MYDNFTAIDRWTAAELNCIWKANIVAIATRHADAVDVRFEVSVSGNDNPRAVWMALPCTAWVEHKKRTGNVITDALTAQIGGRYLKQAIESGYDNGREIYTLTLAEVLEHAEAVVREAGHTSKLPRLPLSGGSHAEDGEHETHIPSSKMPPSALPPERI